MPAERCGWAWGRPACPRVAQMFHRGLLPSSQCLLGFFPCSSKSVSCSPHCYSLLLARRRRTPYFRVIWFVFHKELLRCVQRTLGSDVISRAGGSILNSFGLACLRLLNPPRLKSSSSQCCRGPRALGVFVLGEGGAAGGKRGCRDCGKC